MSSTNPTTQDAASLESSTPRQSPSPNEADKNQTTPANDASSSVSGTKSAPGHTPAARGRSNTRKSVHEPPTLLADFFRGRPSPARIAAERERKKSVEAVKAELRHQMRQNAVQRVPPPGGVRDRVKAWQKANVAAMVDACPDDAATEPPDVAFKGEDIESVTEEDRVRIKMRQKKRRPKSTPNMSFDTGPDKSVGNEKDASKGKEKEGSKRPASPVSKPPPKKRVVSDEHWLKTKPRQRKVSPRHKPFSGPQPIPKDFLLRTAAKPPISNRIKDWAEKVEIPDTPPPRMYRHTRGRSNGGATDNESELRSDLTGDTDSFLSSSVVTAPRSAKSAPADDGIRVRPIRKEKAGDDGIRIKASSPASSATSRPGSVRRTRSGKKKKSTNSSRKLSHSSSSDIIEVIEDRPDIIEVIEEIDSLLESTPMRRRSTKRKSSTRPKSYHAESSKKREEDEWEDEDDLGLDEKRLSDSDLLSSLLDRSIADIPGDIPFGHSAFTELDLPLRGGPPRSRPKRPKVDRNTSLKAMPKMFKKVMEEGKKIIHEMNEPSRQPTGQKPPSIEKWLNNTVDPLVEPVTLESMTDSDSGAETEKEIKVTVKETKKAEPKPEPREAPREAPKEVPTEDAKEKPAEKPAEKPKPESVPLPKQRTSETSRPAKPKGARRQSSGSRHTRNSSSKGSLADSQENTVPLPDSVLSDPIDEELDSELTVRSETEPKKSHSKPELKSEKRELKTQSSGSSLKRRQATRGNTSPVKSSSKRPFLGILKEVFSGESKSLPGPPKTYQSREERAYANDFELDYEEGSEIYDDYDRSHNSGPPRDDQEHSQLSSYLYSDYDESEASTTRSPPHDDRRKGKDSGSKSPNMSGPRFRPPTNGHHELSTILSEEHYSGLESDMSSELTDSTLSQSTVTHTTELTRNSSISKSKSQRSGLKRRLTKHSDLISVLSLPDDQSVPTGLKSNRSRPSVRRVRGGSKNVTVRDLLKEFSEDENLFQRELKTLVDGVIPVLLSQVADGNDSTGFLGSKSDARRNEALAKSVINMGMSLEKLKNAHHKAPLWDLRKLAMWAHGVVPIYDKYLDVWRMGFQDLIVNLAPAAGIPEDEDSLLNAMPRNEDGDVLDEQGERIDVAHLLKRPVLRLKQMGKFIKCVDEIIHTHDTYDLVKDFERLHEKARVRHKEELARMVDEDASNTDTTRSRDMRTLAPLERVVIDHTRQVSAKDFFSFDLEHSNGQRLECQVELIQRDNERIPGDEGDLLIRETGDGRRSYLLFPPIPMSLISARTGHDEFDLVLMIRGTHNGRPWYELMHLSADSEDQILDWLDILPIDPIPPADIEPSVIGEDPEDDAPRQKFGDVPVGVRRSLRESTRTPDYDAPASPTSPTNCDTPQIALPKTPEPSIPDIEELELMSPPGWDDRSHPINDHMRPNPLKLKSPNAKARGDGPPLPPIHRTFSPSPSPSPSPGPQPQSKSFLKPPTDARSGTGNIKRWGSSPLKHEYLPSEGSMGESSREGSSITGTSLSREEEEESDHESDISSESESSDDDIDSIDIPQTELGFSIKPEAPQDPRYSVVDSLCSLTPSNSASQAGLHGKKTTTQDNAIRYSASISRWSDKGVWKDIAPSSCTIIVTPGMIEAYLSRATDNPNGRPILALDLTPLVLIRQSTSVDLEIRSSVQSHCSLASVHNGGNFRFRCSNTADCYNLYMAVHNARLNNQKFIQLENETRFKSFGEHKPTLDADATSSKRRSWFGRKNSYRSSVRAPTQSHDGASTTPSTSLSASSFLKRLTGRGNLSFNLARSSLDRQSRASSYGNSLYAPSFDSGTPPRSPSVSVENSGGDMTNFGSEDIRIRLHLLASSSKWEDYGNCSLQIRRPPPGWHQALRANHGLEKRVTVTTMPRKKSESPNTVLDAVLGSGCFTPMGSRGVVCGIWEEVKDADGIPGMAPATGATGGNVKKWCFQFSSPAEANWVLRLVHQEVLRAY